MMARHWFHWHQPKVEVAFREAVVAYCPDLTDPTAACKPLAVLLVATIEDGLIAAMAVLQIEKATLDPLTAEFLSDLPEALCRHLDRAVAEAGREASSADILTRLQDSLRSSISVTHVGDEERASVHSHKLYPYLTSRALDTLTRELHIDPNSLIPTTRPTSSPRDSKPKGPTPRTVSGPRRSGPESRVWCPA